MLGDEMIPNLSGEAEEKIIKAMASAMAESDGRHSSTLGERLEFETVARRQYFAHKAMLSALPHMSDQSENNSK
jgi:hypothetical protein